MTALNWYMDETQIIIQSDTLVSVNEAGEYFPAFTTTKIYPAPHIKSVITGTGIQRVTTEWFTQVCSSMIIEDVEMLNDYTPRHLREIYGNLAKEGAIGTATVYQFGWSKEEGKFQGFAYRSENHFDSERLAFGTAMKPPIDDPESFFDTNPALPLEALLDIQQREDRSKPISDRIGIGGDKLQFLAYISPETSSFMSEYSHIGQFKHYDLDWEMIISNLPSNYHSLLSKNTRKNYEKVSMMKANSDE